MPSGESVGSNKEEPMLLAAAIDRANSRRVITIFVLLLCCVQKLVVGWNCRRGDLELPGKL
jgi:hypothetical protein